MIIVIELNKKHETLLGKKKDSPNFMDKSVEKKRTNKQTTTTKKERKKNKQHNEHK